MHFYKLVQKQVHLDFYVQLDVKRVGVAMKLMLVIFLYT